MKKALIFGVTGQDGSYLTEILLEKGYSVYGMIRKSATGNTKNIEHLINNKKIFGKKFFLEKGDLKDTTSIYRIVSKIKPDEIYNEADQDHVGWSYEMVDYSSDITGAAVGRILEIIKQLDRDIKFFQPCSSNMFGRTEIIPQNENTPFNPLSPYAIAKTMAFYYTKYYREAFGLFASSAIFYNHESPRCTTEYVTRKITSTVAKIALRKENKLMLGDTSAKIDWGYAKEYMEAAWKILQLKNSDDFVIATGEAHSVYEFAEEAFKLVNLDISKHLLIDKKLLRPTKTNLLLGDTKKAREVFGFRPKTKFKRLVKIMVDYDLKLEDK